MITVVLPKRGNDRVVLEQVKACSTYTQWSVTDFSCKRVFIFSDTSSPGWNLEYLIAGHPTSPYFPTGRRRSADQITDLWNLLYRQPLKGFLIFFFIYKTIISLMVASAEKTKHFLNLLLWKPQKVSPFQHNFSKQRAAILQIWVYASWSVFVVFFICCVGLFTGTHPLFSTIFT